MVFYFSVFFSTFLAPNKLLVNLSLESPKRPVDGLSSDLSKRLVISFSSDFPKMLVYGLASDSPKIPAFVLGSDLPKMPVTGLAFDFPKILLSVLASDFPKIPVSGLSSDLSLLPNISLDPKLNPLDPLPNMLSAFSLSSSFLSPPKRLLENLKDLSSAPPKILSSYFSPPNKLDCLSSALLSSVNSLPPSSLSEPLAFLSLPSVFPSSYFLSIPAAKRPPSLFSPPKKLPLDLDVPRLPNGLLLFYSFSSL